jgi:hypothetical protein
MKMRLLYILYCPPHPCYVTARTLYYLRHSTKTDLPLPHHPHPAFLLAGAPAHHAVTFFAAAGRGGRPV